MTLLLVEVGRFVTGAALWMVALVLITGTAAAAILYVVERGLDPRALGLAVVAGGALSATMHRIGTGLIWAPRVGDRPLPVVWAALGALVAAIALVVRRRRSKP